MSTSRIALAASVLTILVSPALAAPGKLVLVLGGEAYDGPPKFAVSFDGKMVGEGVLDQAIDTGKDQRFAEAEDKAPYIQSFDFDIPEAAFKADGEIGIHFLNEAYGGDGSNRDRNLFLASASINGETVLAPDFSTVSETGIEPNALLDDFLLLKDGTADARVTPPDGGWPEAETAAVTPAEEPVEEVEVAAAEPAAEDEAVADVAADEPVVEPEPEEPAAVAVDEPEPEPVAEAAPVPQAKPAEEVLTTEAVVEPEPVDVASTEPVAAAASDCTVETSFDIVGFNENSNELTTRVAEQLDLVAAALKGQACAVSLTGYSDTQGSYAVNALFSVERAQNALRYLRDQGVSFAEAQATGVGETTQFGDRPSQNRRVVIAVKP